MSSNMSDRVIW